MRFNLCKNQFFCNFVLSVSKINTINNIVYED